MATSSTSQIQACIERLNAGDATARDALILHSHQRLQRLTRKMLQDYRRLRTWQDTDDVLQSALMRLLRALEAVPPVSVVEYFRLASRQIRRELLDLVRHYYGPQGAGANEVRPAPDASSTASPVAALGPPDTLDPSRLAYWTEFHEQVEALPAKERLVFDLLWYQGLTQLEAASVMNTSPATVKRWWLSARLQLQAALGGEGPPI